MVMTMSGKSTSNNKITCQYSGSIVIFSTQNFSTKFFQCRSFIKIRKRQKISKGFKITGKFSDEIGIVPYNCDKLQMGLIE